MDPDTPSSTPSPRKVKFAPKGPPRRKARAVEPKTEVDGDDADNEAAEAFLRRVNEHLARRGPKTEKKSSVQVTFAHGVAASTSVRTYGKPREGNDNTSNGLGLKDSAFDSGQILISSPSTARIDGTSESSVHVVGASSQKEKKEYIEPWDYHHSYYPITLPLRRPYSGDPELLDEAEFGEAMASLEYSENTMCAASELGLLEKNEKAQMLFVQLPANLPLVKRVASADGTAIADNSKVSGSEGSSSSIAKGKEIAGSPMSSGGGTVASARRGKEIAGGGTSSRDTVVPASAKGKETAGGSISSWKGNASRRGCSLEELPGGYMGKMLVYKSGAIKLKLGETLYDVSPGSDCIFSQDIFAINTVDKHCSKVGELGKRAVVTPDIESLLDSVIDLG